MSLRLIETFERLSKEPEERQRAIIALIEEELDEQLWQEKFAASKDMLKEMADETLAEQARGETIPVEDLFPCDRD